MTSTLPHPDTAEAALVESLRPQLQELDNQRFELRASTVRKGGAVLGISLLAALAIPLAAGPDSDFVFFSILAVIIGVGLPIYIGYKNQQRWQARVQENLVPAACQALAGELAYERDVPVDDFLAPFEALGLVGDSNSRRVQHHFRGEHRGRQFELAHACLYWRTSGKDRTNLPVFNGLLFRIQTPERIEAGITISPNFGRLTKTFDGPSRSTGHSTFDDKFRVHLDPDNEQARHELGRVLTPEMQDSLLAVNEAEGRLAYGRATFHAGFKYDSLYIALSRYEVGVSIGPIKIERPRPFLKVGLHLRTHSQLDQALSDMIDDIHTVYRILERLPPVAGT